MQRDGALPPARDGFEPALDCIRLARPSEPSPVMDRTQRCPERRPQESASSPPNLAREALGSLAFFFVLIGSTFLV